MGHQRIWRLAPHPDQDWLREEHQTIEECYRWIDSGLCTARGAESLEDLLERVEKDGVLSIRDFVLLRRTLAVYQTLRQVEDSHQYEIIMMHLERSILPVTLIQAINHAISEDGEVRDQASPQLGEIRRHIRRVEREIDTIFEGILHSREWASYIQEGIITLRFGRRVIPIKNEFRHSVPGIVHDESGSGQTVFVEPLKVVERQNRLTTLRQDEMREIERILGVLTGQVAVVSSTLEEIHHQLAWFDTHLAVTRYGLAHQSVIPEIGGQRLTLTNARHPLIGHPVPISLELSSDRPAIVITGPNTGGKTVALKTAGLMVMMALSGLMIPADPGTTIPLYRQVWADIGDEQSLEQSLSTFSGHLVRLSPMMEGADQDTLCLIDEIGAGTDPEEGSALAEAMIQHLVEKKASAIISTHYSRLKLLGLHDPRIQNALVEFDRETLAPTYHLVLGSPGSSHAFYIARRLGFPSYLVDRAETIMDHEAITLADAIQAMNELQQQLRLDQQEMLRKRGELEQMARELARREQDLQERLEKDRSKAEKVWRRELDELTEAFNQTVELVRSQEGAERGRALEKLREQYRGLARVPRGMARQSVVSGSSPEKAGDRVRVAGFPDIGTIVELKGQSATVEIGSLRMKLQLSELERVSDLPANRVETGRERGYHAIGRQKSENLGLEVDLRGMREQEALLVVDKYLDDAVLAGAPFVRIIHGKGTGALRRAVTLQLKGDSRVLKYRLGDPGEGGDGVTVAFFEEMD